jgi:putative endonuclease
VSGKRNTLAGLSAEEAVTLRYAASGATCRARRWRGGGGEIDLVMEANGQIIFVEVKQRASLEAAAAALRPAQQARLREAAAAYLVACPAGQETNCRFDAALVDRHGAIEIIEHLIA